MNRPAPRLAPLFACVLALPTSAAPQTTGIADLYEPGETVHWVFEQAGSTIGHCSSRYDGPALMGGVSAHRFESWVRLEFDLPTGSYEQDMYGELWVDGNGSPLVYRYHTRVAGVYAGIDLTIDGEHAVASVQQGTSSRLIEADLGVETSILSNNFVSHVELILARFAPAAGQTAKTEILSSDLLQVIPLEIRHLEDFEDPEHGPGSVYEDSLGETLRWAHSGRLLSVEVAAQGLVLRRHPGPFENKTLVRPELAQRAEDLNAEDVAIEHGEVSLAGTVTRPADAGNGLPAVLFLSGSGPQDRDGYSSGIDVGTHEILDHLTRAGFLVLRVDDRGVGSSTGPTEDMTFEDIVEDARACLRFLRAREDVDPARIALIGHSEGGQVAPQVALAEEGVAALALMAAPGRNLHVISREQFLAAKALEGVTGSELEAYGAVVDAFLADVNSGAELSPESLPGELAMFIAARAWLASHAPLDPARAIQGVTCPVLVLQGATDIQVSAERDAQTLHAALESAGHPDHTLVVFPGLDHLFKKTPGETPSGMDYFTDRRVAPEFLDALTSWLSERLLEPR